MVSKIGSACVTLIALVGCGGSSLSVDTVAQPQAEIRAAEEAGAGAVPQAALHLKMARDQLAQGDKLAANGDDNKASRAYGRSRSDAELAVLLARHHAIKEKAQQAIDKANALTTAGPGEK